ELAAPITFEIALRMPNFAELQTRLAQGQQIAPAEMASRYYPSASDYQNVIAWVKAQGLTVTRTDANRLAVFGQGSVAAVGSAFQVSFGRVAADDADYTSALTAPSLPADVATPVLGVHGLQPHLRLRRRLARLVHPAAGGGGGSEYTPAQIAQHYNASGLGLTGAGQTIAIFAGAYASSSDLQAFWNAIGLATPPTIQQVTVGTGPAANDSGDQQEATLDEEWAGGMAPGATIRVYGANDTDPNFIDEIFQQVAADLPNEPSLHVLSMSYGFDETALDSDYIMIVSQYCANLASAGVSIMNASGDDGSNQDGKLQVSVPTSDPNVTGVGGTTYDASGETGWSGSGGGISVVFSRPSWQAGTGVPAGTMRLCPDVAAAADPNHGALVYFQGQEAEVGGTSWATPVWAAFCAMINQYRASQGSGPIGNLNTRIYSLIGTQALFDITSGNNGQYSCGIGYDLVTGVGAPNMQVLYNSPLTPPSNPVIYAQFGNVNVTPGVPGTFYAVATGAAPLSYQWQRQAAGASGWVNLSDNGSYQGTATPMLRVLGAGSAGAMSGDQFQCVATNAAGTATSKPELLIVNPTGVSTLAGWPGAWGTADGTGFAARFESPGAVRGDGAGNLYVADGAANTVRKVTAAGVVTTVVGLPGTAGATNGSTSVATLDEPAGVALDSAGNLYIADDGNDSIRELSGGIVSTYATGFTDAEDVACDSRGYLYVADGESNTVKVVAPGGVVSVLAGSGARGFADGTKTAATFDDPVGVAVDASFNVYVADQKNGAVRMISPQGVVTTLAQGLSSPTGVTLDSAGNIYVACQGDSTIREVANGVVTLVAGIADVSKTVDGPLGAACLAAPTQVYWDPSSGIIYIADSNTAENGGTNAGNNFGGTLRTLVTAAQTQASVPVISDTGGTDALNPGDSLTLTADASGASALSYQWYFNGQAIPGATGPSYTISDYSGSEAGSYSVTVTDSAGSTTATIATVATATARLINLSARAESSPGNGVLTAGFVIGGAGSKDLLLRGPGPTLASFGVANPLPDPLLTLYDSGQLILATNQGWDNSATLAADFAATGAFAYPANSIDSAMAQTLATGQYSITVAGAAGDSGTALAEVYDRDALTATARLINISCRSDVSSTNQLIAGFTIGGTGSELVLIRGIGPTLSQFGISNPLAAPVVTLYDASGNPLQSNRGWGGAANLSAAFSQVGAFALPASSADSALLVSLAAGAQYTAEVSSGDGTSGVALVEVYEVP
ncbi:MAG TPA: protease pro-enzyme activation domain-containing protein, partial [Opitutaceae bacterium]|nr:protease pro-enzyme activation domain-containing protein [Opitutaceae bacterium]